MWPGSGRASVRGGQEAAHGANVFCLTPGAVPLPGFPGKPVAEITIPAHIDRVTRQDLSVATNTVTKAPGPMHSSIGLKLMMAVSGLFFVFFVLFHMYGNLKILAGHETFDEYAHHLREMFMPILPYEGFLWCFRLVLILALVAHAYSAFTLWSRANTARGSNYAVRQAAAATWRSKAMRWGGVALLAFIVFHLAQFTLMWINVGGYRETPAERVILAFQHPWVVLVYLIALAALGMHLLHGTWSAIQTLGWTGTPAARARAKSLSLFIATVTIVGFMVPPLAIMFGLIK